MVDRDNRLQKVIVNDTLVREARRCVEAWRSLQELGGVHNSHAARLLEQERKVWAEQAQAAAAAASRRPARRLPRRPQRRPHRLLLLPRPPSPKRRRRKSPDEPYIETARCTSCNECTQINDKMFGYDANKQAFILNAGCRNLSAAGGSRGELPDLDHSSRQAAQSERAWAR